MNIHTRNILCRALKNYVLAFTRIAGIVGVTGTVLICDEENGRTVTNVKKLDEAERPAELARIMGASEYSEAAVSHAAELIKKAAEASL